MRLTTTEIAGNVKIKGIFRASNLTIVGPNVREPDEIRRGTFTDAVAAPAFAATGIELGGILRIGAGAAVQARWVQAFNIEIGVGGSLQADRAVARNILAVAAEAVLDCDFTGSCAVRFHRDAFLRGGARRVALANIQRARDLLDGALPLPEVDFRWLESAFELAGWECVARSSSGNGCNYGREDKGTVYVPLRNDIHDFDGTVRRALERIATSEVQDG